MVSTVRMGIIRAEATFGHPVYYAMYCALIIPLALYMWQNERRMWNGCILGLNIVAAFLTESSFSLFYSLLKSSWKKATFKNSRNMNNSFFLCFVSYVAVMLSVADVSQLLWVIIALYIIYNAKAQAIVSE